LRGKGRALFADLAEWVEPVESSPPPEMPVQQSPAEPSAAPPVSEAPPASDVEAGASGSGERDPQESLPSPTPAGDRDGDGFRFLAMEAARAAAVRASPLPEAAPPSWRWEAPPPASEGIQIDPEGPMRALRIPGLLEPEAVGPIAPAFETSMETSEEGEASMGPVPTPSPERLSAPRPRSVDEAQLRQLHGRIDELYRRIAGGAIPDPGAAEQALSWLKQAREALLKPDGYDEAEYYYSLALTRYAIARRLWRWSYTYGLFVFLWGLAWLGAYLYALTAGRGYSAWVVPPGYEGIWEPIMWGGLGGVCGIFYSLYWHVAIRRDFDRQYVMWYLVQPILGSMIGMIIFMIITVGFFTIQGTPAPANPLFMYLIAFIAGFRQRFFLELIDRIVQTFTPNPRSGNS